MDAIDVFKFGVKPAWEDPSNNGGVQFNWKAPEDISLAKITEEWEKLVLMAISGDPQLPHTVRLRVHSLPSRKLSTECA